jgi:hypothetical protein
MLQHYDQVSWLTHYYYSVLMRLLLGFHPQSVHKMSRNLYAVGDRCKNRDLYDALLEQCDVMQ